MSTKMVRLVCPNLKCRKVLSVPLAARGKVVRCRNCGMRVQVPGASKPKPVATPTGDANASS